MAVVAPTRLSVILLATALRVASVPVAHYDTGLAQGVTLEIAQPTPAGHPARLMRNDRFATTSTGAASPGKEEHPPNTFRARVTMDSLDSLLETSAPPLNAGSPTRFPWTKACTEGAKSAYVDGANGKNWQSYDGSESKPYKTIQHAVDKVSGTCTTIYIKEGTYTNQGYRGGTWKNNPSKVLDLDGVTKVILRNFGGQTGTGIGGDKVIVKFDGPGGFVGGSSDKPVTDVEIYGFEIQGPNQDITYADAIGDRITGSKYYSGRGIAIWKGARIHIHHMKVHNTPASGLRVDNSDYVVVEESEVCNSTWWSSSAESAVVLAQSVNVDDEEGIKMILRNNKVHGNMNKIPYYNNNYAWDYTPLGSHACSSDPACKSEADAGKCTGGCQCPWQCRYGKSTQDYIIDGMGVYVTRNSGTYLKGKMELSGNECHGNGINGLVFHRTFRGIVKKNLIYDNGVVPLDGFDEHIKESTDWMSPLKKQRQPYSGLVLNNAAEVKLFGNKVRARYDDDYAFTTQFDSGVSYNLSNGGNNKVCKGKVSTDLAAYVADGSTADCGSWFR